MTQNPFEAPRAPDVQQRPLGTGTFDIGVTVTESWRAVSSDLGMVIGTTLVGMLAYLAGYITIVGIIFILPVLMWGGVKWVLNLNDGRAELSDIFSGFQDYWPRLGGVLMMMVLMMVPMLVPYAVVFAGALTETPALVIVGQLALFVLMFAVMIRLYFAIFFVVDRGLPAMDAIKASWEVMSEQKLNTLGLVFLSSIIGSLGVFACGLGLFVSVPMSYLMFASAYRQMVGPTQ